MPPFNDSDNESELKAPILSDSESESGSESESQVNSDSEWETDSESESQVNSDSEWETDSESGSESDSENLSSEINGINILNLFQKVKSKIENSRESTTLLARSEDRAQSSRESSSLRSKDAPKASTVGDGQLSEEDGFQVKSETLAGIQRIVDSNKDSGMSDLVGQPIMDCFTDISNNKFQDMEPTDVYRYIIKFLKSVNKSVLSNPDNMRGGGMIDMIHMMIGSAIGGILEQNPRVSKEKIAHIMIAMDKKYGSPDSKHSPDEDDDDEFILLG